MVQVDGWVRQTSNGRRETNRRTRRRGDTQADPRFDGRDDRGMINSLNDPRVVHALDRRAAGWVSLNGPRMAGTISRRHGLGLAFRVFVAVVLIGTALAVFATPGQLTRLGTFESTGLTPMHSALEEPTDAHAGRHEHGQHHQNGDERSTHPGMNPA